MKNKIIKILIEFLIFISIILILFLILIEPQKRGSLIFYTYIISSILTIGIYINIILKENYTYSKFMWITIVFGLPFFGIIIYFIFNRTIKVARLNIERPLLSKKEELEDKIIHFDSNLQEEIFTFARKISDRNIYCNDTNTKVLNNGNEYFPMLINKIKEAKEFIYLEYYIIRIDTIGKEVLEILRKKSSEGVICKVIYDPLGSKLTKKELKYLQTLIHDNVEIKSFDKILKIDKINYRNHRKIQIIDGKIGFIGGINLGDEYYHKSKKYGFWRDTALLVTGNGVSSLEKIFIKDWYYVTNEYLNCSNNSIKIDSKSIVITVESGPDNEASHIKEIFYKMINSSRKNIMIVTPYLMLEPEISFSLISASKSGVEVKILVPGLADKLLINQSTKSYYERLLKYGIKIYEYTNTFVHSKIIIIDEKIASVGTVNFDPRSFNINFEVTTIFSNESVNDLINSFEADLSNSKIINYLEWKRRSFLLKIIQNTLNLFSPLL